MQEQELQRLLKQLSLDDKIAQLLQISGGNFEEVDVVTGPNTMFEMDENIVYNLGSVINSVGADRTKRIQDKYLKKSRHKIPLLFMADAVHGLKTVFPIPLGSACSWDMEQIKKMRQLLQKNLRYVGNMLHFLLW